MHNRTPFLPDEEFSFYNSRNAKLNNQWRERVGIEPTLPDFGRQHRI
jgi:hypothetical protein